MTEATFDAATKELGDKIVGLTLLQAKALSDYLKQVHGIEPAGGGVVMAAGPAGGGGARWQLATGWSRQRRRRGERAATRPARARWQSR